MRDADDTIGLGGKQTPSGGTHEVPAAQGAAKRNPGQANANSEIAQKGRC